ncbi:MAG: NAD-dependent epimerase/dehydratase family protein [Candidatus Omnitrophota bacterium]
MKILVTGGAGFIGSNVADRYVADGHDVVVIDNLSNGKKENLNPGAKFYQIGIESEELPNVFKKEKPDIVNHHAAQVNLRKSVEDPAFDANVNITGSLKLFQQCAKHNVKKIIFASSGGGAYGEYKNFPPNENHPLQPFSPYGIAKISVEMYLCFYSAAYGLDYTLLRYANVYGPRQSPLGEAGVVAVFTNAMLNNKTVTINGDGTQTRDYVYVDDVAEANAISLFKGDRGVFNIGTGVETNVNELAGKLRDLAGYKLGIKHGLPIPGEQKRSVIDPLKAKKELNWNSSVLLDSGISKTVDWFKKTQKKG